MRPPRPTTHSTICPLCAGPKTVQAHICQPCFIDEKRAAFPIVHGTSAAAKRCGCDYCRAHEANRSRDRRRRAGLVSGATTARPQPQSHPWRKSLTRVA